MYSQDEIVSIKDDDQDKKYTLVRIWLFLLGGNWVQTCLVNVVIAWSRKDWELDS